MTVTLGLSPAYKGNDSRTWSTITMAKVRELEASGYSVSVYPRKGLVVVNGFIKFHLRK